MATSKELLARIDLVAAELERLGLDGTAQLWRTEPATWLQIAEILARASTGRDGIAAAQRWRALALSVLPPAFRTWAPIIELYRSHNPAAAADIEVWLWGVTRRHKSQRC